jgi:hypothetical protein
MCATTLAVLLLISSRCLGADVLFEETVKDGLFARWQVVGFDKKDYRIKDGRVEMRVQNGEGKKAIPMIKVVIPLPQSPPRGQKPDATRQYGSMLII